MTSCPRPPEPAQRLPPRKVGPGLALSSIEAITFNLLTFITERSPRWDAIPLTGFFPRDQTPGRPQGGGQDTGGSECPPQGCQVPCFALLGPGAALGTRRAQGTSPNQQGVVRARKITAGLRGRTWLGKHSSRGARRPPRTVGHRGFPIRTRLHSAPHGRSPGVPGAAIPLYPGQTKRGSLGDPP